MPAGLKNSAQISKSVCRFLQVFQEILREHEVEDTVREGQAGDIGHYCEIETLIEPDHIRDIRPHHLPDPLSIIVRISLAPSRSGVEHGLLGPKVPSDGSVETSALVRVVWIETEHPARPRMAWTSQFP
jgi:hypothetical protein